MGNKFVVLSDIHANLSALKAVIQDFKDKYSPDGVILLGDLINYGMRPNEVISEIKLLSLEFPIICNLHGNHERALIDSEQLPRFSSERGRTILEYTKRVLTRDSFEYVYNQMEIEGYSELLIHGCSILCVHGSLRDVYWGKLSPESMKDGEYARYDYVLSGHSHIPHHVEMFYSGGLPELRGKKRTVFLNPGSVGQPRNQNPSAQYLYWDMEAGLFHQNSVNYDIELEQSLYTDEVDVFYRDRLFKGI